MRRLSWRIIILGGIIFLFLLIVIWVILQFSRRPRPAPEMPPVGEPIETPRQFFGINLPSIPFFISPPSSLPSKSRVALTPQPREPSPSIPIPSPVPTPFISPIPPSSQQVFDFLWPKEYRNYLAHLQDVFINSGLISPKDRLSLQNEDEIITFLTRSVDSFAALGVIKKEDVPNFKKGIQVELRNHKVQEYHYYLQIAPLYPSPPPFPVAKPSAIQPSISNRMFASILNSIFMPLKAQIECYIVRKPGWPIPGFVLWAPTCNSFLPGLFGGIPIGCLNAVCPFGNAIWDPATGICGCD